MKSRLTAAASVFAVALTTSVAAQAQQPPVTQPPGPQSPSPAAQSMPHGPGHGGRHHAGQHPGHTHQGHGHQGHAGRHGQDGMMMPGAGLLRGLNLSEAQRDRVFAILHAQAPQMRTQALEARKARQALQQVALAGELDEARLQDLAQRASRANTDLAVLRARTHNALFKELTPEQQAQVKARMEARPQHGAHNRAGMHRMHAAS